METITSKKLSDLTQVSVRWIEKKCETGEITATKNKAGEWLITETELQHNPLITQWLQSKGLFWSC